MSVARFKTLARETRFPRSGCAIAMLFSCKDELTQDTRTSAPAACTVSLITFCGRISAADFNACKARRSKDNDGRPGGGRS